jgi:hypothetical protein
MSEAGCRFELERWISSPACTASRARCGTRILNERRNGRHSLGARCSRPVGLARARHGRPPLRRPLLFGPHGTDQQVRRPFEISETRVANLDPELVVESHFRGSRERQSSSGPTSCPFAARSEIERQRESVRRARSWNLSDLGQEAGRGRGRFDLRSDFPRGSRPVGRSRSEALSPSSQVRPRCRRPGPSPRAR